MIDLVAGAALALLIVRGWHRGLIREAMDLVGLIVGIIVAFRTSSLVGPVVEGLLGVSPEVGRFIGGGVVFLAVGIAAAFAARALERAWSLPGLALSNKVGGAGLAGAWGLFMATLLFSLLAIAPAGGAFASTLDDSLAAGFFTDPDGVPQKLFTSVSGDRIIQTILEIRDVAGVNRVVIEGDERLEIPAAQPDEIAVDPTAAAQVFDLLNRARVRNQLDPLAMSEALSEVAAGHARDMYLNGYFSHHSPTTGSVSDRLAEAGIVYRIAGENLALAATPDGVHEGLMDSPGHRANILGADFRWAGVAVVDGPLGLMTVQVFVG